MPDIAQRVYPLNGGLNDSLPPYGIGPRQLAKAKNMRVWRNELRTCKGYVSATSSLISGSVTAMRALAYAIREDGTEDLVAASDGGYWKLVGDTKTLLSVGAARGLVTSVSGAAVVGDSSARFDGDYHVGDLFWITADGVASAVAISSIESISGMTLVSAYGGGASAGAHSSWWKQTDARTKTAFWANRWFFVNGTDYLTEWDTATFRRSGFERPNSQMFTSTSLTGVSASGGDLSASSWYYYTAAFRDKRGMTSFIAGTGDGGINPAMRGVSTTSANKTINLSWAFGFDVRWYGTDTPARAPPPEAISVVIYRSGPLTAAAAFRDQPLITFYELNTVGITTSAYTDDGSVSASLFKTQPAYNFFPDAGYEDLTVIENRLAAISGRKLFISGLPPTDPNTDTAGRLEPEYWSIEHRIGDGEEKGGYGFLTLRGRTYILGSLNMYAVAVRGDDPAVWGVIRYMPNVGSVSRWGIAAAGDVAYWLARIRGRITVVSFDGYRITEIGEPVQGILDTIDTTKFSEIAAGVGKGFYWLCIPITGGGYKTLEFNSNAGVTKPRIDKQGRMTGARKLQTWCWRDWQVQEFAQAGGDIYAGFGDGMVKQLESGYAQVSSAQAYEWETAGYDLGIPEWGKHFHSMQSEFDVYAGSPSVSAKYIVDEGTPAALPDSPVALSATPEYRVGIPTAVYGQRAAFNFTASGSDLDFAHRGLVIKGTPDPQDQD